MRMVEPSLARRTASALLAAAALLLLAQPARAAIEVERVVSPGGIEAWLVRDERTPVISMQFSFDGGTALDPEGREGAANMMAALLTEGAGDMPATVFQERLADAAISLEFSADRDRISGSVRTVTDNAGIAWDMARTALTAPRFDEDAVERVRAQVLASLRRELQDTSTVASQVFRNTVYAGHPYGRPPRGTQETVARIGRDALQAVFRDRIARDNLLVAVAGDITPDELGPALDRVFGALPERSAPFEMPRAEAKGAGEIVLVPRPTPQTVVQVGHGGILRADPDWYAATIVNYVLGGGSFSSRLMQEIRVERGLTYGVSSGIAYWDRGALAIAAGSTANETADEFAQLLKAEWERMAAEGPTTEELADAKTYLTGSFPLSFTSTGAIARILLSVRQEDLGIDFLDRRNALIEAVTAEDARRVARRLLDRSRLLTVVVGAPDGIEPTRVIEDWRGG